MTLGDHLSLLDIMGAELIKNMIHIMHRKSAQNVTMCMQRETVEDFIIQYLLFR